MRKLLLPLLLLFAHQAWAAYSYINSTSVATSSQTQEQTSSYSPTSGDSLILVIKTRLNALPLKGYSGSGTPGDGVNTYSLIGYTFDVTNTPAYTLTGTLSGGATSATLSSTWAGSTGAYWIVFSDGEFRSVSLTNASAAVTWTTGLAANCTASVLIGGNPNLFAVYQATGVAGTAVQAGASSSATQIDGVLLQEFNGISAATALTAANGTAAMPSDMSWNAQAGPGTTANAVTSGNVTISSSAMLWGLTIDDNASGTVTAGTGFTGRGLWGSYALPEDLATSSTGAATYTAGNGFDTFRTIAIAFGLSSPLTTGGSTAIFNQIPVAQWQAITASQSLTNAQPAIECNAAGGAVTLTLPTAVNNFTTFRVKKTDSSANTCTITTSASQKIDGASSVILSTQNAAVNLFSDNSNWQNSAAYQSGALVTTGSFTVTWSGFSVNPGNSTANYVVANGIVVIHIPGGFGTSNAFTWSFSGLPAALQPSGSRCARLTALMDNGSDVTTGFACVTNPGSGYNTVSFYKGEGVSWTNSGNKGTNTAYTTDFIYSLQ